MPQRIVLEWRLSCSGMTVCVQTTAPKNRDDSCKILQAPPIFHRFVGQPIINLGQWLESHFGTTDLQILEAHPDEEN